jgi:hypothetical protein
LRSLLRSGPLRYPNLDTRYVVYKLTKFVLSNLAAAAPMATFLRHSHPSASAQHLRWQSHARTVTHGHRKYTATEKIERQDGIWPTWGRWHSMPLRCRTAYLLGFHTDFVYAADGSPIEHLEYEDGCRTIRRTPTANPHRGPIWAKEPWRRWRYRRVWQRAICNLQIRLLATRFESHPHRQNKINSLQENGLFFEQFLGNTC